MSRAVGIFSFVCFVPTLTIRATSMSNSRHPTPTLALLEFRSIIVDILAHCYRLLGHPFTQYSNIVCSLPFFYFTLFLFYLPFPCSHPSSRVGAKYKKIKGRKYFFPFYFLSVFSLLLCCICFFVFSLFCFFFFSSFLHLLFSTLVPSLFLSVLQTTVLFHPLGCNSSTFPTCILSNTAQQTPRHTHPLSPT